MTAESVIIMNWRSMAVAWYVLRLISMAIICMSCITVTRACVPPIGHGEDRVVSQLAFDVLADQERGGLPTGQVQRQPLDEALQLHFVRAGTLGLADYGAE